MTVTVPTVGGVPVAVDVPPELEVELLVDVLPPELLPLVLLVLEVEPPELLVLEAGAVTVMATLFDTLATALDATTVAV